MGQAICKEDLHRQSVRLRSETGGRASTAEMSGFVQIREREAEPTTAEVSGFVQIREAEPAIEAKKWRRRRESNPRPAL